MHLRVTKPPIRNKFAEGIIDVAESHFCEQGAEHVLQGSRAQDIDRVHDDLIVRRLVAEVLSVGLVKDGFARDVFDIRNVFCGSQVEVPDHLAHARQFGKPLVF
jgi:hypothetical protein